MLTRRKGLIVALALAVLTVPVAALAATGVLGSPDAATPSTIDEDSPSTSSTIGDDMDDDHLATTSPTIDDRSATTSSTLDDDLDDDSDDVGEVDDDSNDDLDDDS
ncbi:MAG: hypothetical protein A2V75_07550, partial [Actinobacteria bacterium RBG_16_70_17]